MNEPTAAIAEHEPGAAIVTSKSASASPWAEFAHRIPKLMEQFDFFKARLETRKKQIRRWRSRFEHDAAVFDTRTEKERATRPFMLDPHVYTNIMAMTTHLTDQVMASAPQIKVRGRGYEDQGDAALERLHNYDLMEANPAPDWVNATLRSAAVEGIAINRMRYVEKEATVLLEPDEADVKDYDAARGEAVAAVGTAPADPAAYSQWEAQVRSQTGRPMPMTPVSGPVKILTRAGTVIDRVSLDDVHWDPTLPTIDQSDQTIWYENYPQRSVLLAAANARPDIWDEDAIRSLPKESGGDYKSGGEIRKASLSALGIKSDDCDPYYDDPICLRQRWSPECPELRYVAIANNKTPITRNPGYYPHNVAEHPFFGFMNVPTDGLSVGISEYQPNGLLNDWLDQLQSMQLYWMALAVFQPMAVASGSDLKQILEDNCVPGGIVELDDFDDIRPLFEKFNQLPALTDGMLSVMRAGLDRATGINETTRGEQATLNRVTGAEFLGRQGSMQVRMKDRLYRFGVTLGNMARFNCSLRFQYGKREHLKNIAGIDPFMAYNRAVLIPAISADYIFTPAAASADAGLQAQQIGELAKFLGQVGGMVPGGQGMMGLVTRYLQAMRIPGADDLAKALQADAQLGTQMQQAQQQITAGAEQLKLVSTQNDALRAKLPIPIPPAAELDAEIKALTAVPEEGAGVAPVEGEQPAGMPPAMGGVQ